MNLMKIIAGWMGKKEMSEEAVLVHLDGQGLPDAIYAEFDLETLEEQLISVIEAKELGEFDGNEFGPGKTTLFMYGASAERLFNGIESVLRSYPLCEGAEVVLRFGGTGSAERKVVLRKEI